LFLLNLVNASFKALDLCQIKLSFLLDDELEGKTEEEKHLIEPNIEKMWADERLPLGYRYFMSTYEQTIVAIVEKGGHKE